MWENVPLVLFNLSHRDRMLLINQPVLLSVPVKIRVKEKLNKARTSILSSVLNPDPDKEPWSLLAHHGFKHAESSRKTTSQPFSCQGSYSDSGPATHSWLVS